MMKICIGMILLTCSLAMADEYRVFTTSEGRSLSAKILTYDAVSGKVQLQREDGKKAAASISAFTDSDKAYADSWLGAKTFASESKLKLKIKREEVKHSKTEIEVDMSDQQGRRGGSGIRNIGTNQNTQYRFILNMDNSANVPLENLSIDYRVYYSQEKAVVDQEKSEKLPEDRPDIYMAVNEEKVRKSSGKIKPLEAKGNKQVATKPINLLERTVNGRGMDANINLKSDLHGIWIKLSMETPDGTIVREISYPPSIPKKFAWDQDE